MKLKNPFKRKVQVEPVPVKSAVRLILETHPNIVRLEFVVDQDVLIYCRDRAMPFSVMEILKGDTSPYGLPSTLQREFWAASGFEPELLREL